MLIKKLKIGIMGIIMNIKIDSDFKINALTILNFKLSI